MKNDRDALIRKEKEPRLSLSRSNYGNRVRLASESKSGVEIGSTPKNQLSRFCIEGLFLFLHPADRTRDITNAIRSETTIKSTTEINVSETPDR